MNITSDGNVRKPNTRSLATYIHRLKKAHGMKLSKLAVAAIDDFLTGSCMERISSEAMVACKISPRRTLTEADFRCAARMIFPAEMFESIDQKASDAIAFYDNSYMEKSHTDYRGANDEIDMQNQMSEEHRNDTLTRHHMSNNTNSDINANLLQALETFLRGRQMTLHTTVHICDC